MSATTQLAAAMEMFPVVAAVGGVIWCAAAPLIGRTRRLNERHRRRHAMASDMRAREDAARAAQKQRMRSRYRDEYVAAARNAGR